MEKFVIKVVSLKEAKAEEMELRGALISFESLANKRAVFSNWINPRTGQTLRLEVSAVEESKSAFLIGKTGGWFTGNKKLEGPALYNQLENMGVNTGELLEVLTNNKLTEKERTEEAAALYDQAKNNSLNAGFNNLLTFFLNFGSKNNFYKGEVLNAGPFKVRLVPQNNNGKRTITAIFGPVYGEGLDELEALTNLIIKLRNFWGSKAVKTARLALNLKEEGATFELLEGFEVEQLTFEEINKKGPFLVSFKRFETQLNIENAGFNGVKEELGFKFLLLYILNGFLEYNGENLTLGLWRSAGVLFLDISKFYIQKSAALYKAKEEEQLAIFEAVKTETGFKPLVIYI
jgi:hypothetical protein